MPQRASKPTESSSAKVDTREVQTLPDGSTVHRGPDYTTTIMQGGAVVISYTRGGEAQKKALRQKNAKKKAKAEKRRRNAWQYVGPPKSATG